MSVSYRSLISHPGSGARVETTQNKENMMKELLKAAPAVALLAAVAFGAITAPEASAAEFCRQDVTGHMRSCGFDGMAQCQAASAAIVSAIRPSTTAATPTPISRSPPVRGTARLSAETRLTPTATNKNRGTN